MKARRRIFARWQNILGLVIAALFIVVAAAAPILSPNDPKNPGPMKSVGRAVDHDPRPPSAKAPLGTLPGQISVFHTLIWGTRSALIFGLAAAAFTAIVGMLVGASSAYFGGWLNDILMRITDAFLAFPLIAGVVFIQQIVSITLTNNGIVTFLTSGGYYTMTPDYVPPWLQLVQRIDPIMIAFILFSWTPYARIMNTLVQRIMQAGYIQAAMALGASHNTVIFRHLIPNTIAPMIVLAARDVGGMVLLQATFTFIGLGGSSLWGALLVQGRDWIIGPGGNIFLYWWLFLPATIALMLFGIGWDLVGDLLNDVLDPHAR